MKHFSYGYTHVQQANAHMHTPFYDTGLLFHKRIHIHNTTNKRSHIHTLPHPEGHADPSLCHKPLSPCQQAPHRFTLHHLGESERSHAQRGGLRQKANKKRQRGGRQTEGETELERNAGLNDKSKVRWRSDLEAGRGEVLGGREAEGERRGVLQHQAAR